MDPYQEIKRITSEPLSKGVCIVCPDRTRRERALTYLLTTKKLEISNKFDSKNFNFNLFKSSVLNLSLFDPSPITLLRNADVLDADETKKLAQFLDKHSFEGTVIVTAPAFTSANPLKKVFQAKFDFVEFSELKGADLRRWIAKELKNFEVQKFSDREIDLILNVGKSDPDFIKNVVEQLSLYINGDRLTCEDIVNIFRITTESQDFAMLESIKGKNKGVKEALINRLLNIEDKSPFLLLAILAKSYSNYFFVKTGLELGTKSVNLREDLAVTSWVFERYADSARFYSSSTLKKCLQSLVIADSRLKNKNLGSDNIFSKLLEQLSC